MKTYSVLIVDDNREWCAAVKKQIEQYPIFKVVPPLHNGQDAIVYIKGNKPDIILLDIIMPICDGFYVIGHVRDHMVNYQPYIYVLSALGTEKTNVIMRKLDVSYYSVKPITPRAVAYNLFKLMGESGESSFSSNPVMQNLDDQIEDFLYELGAPLHLSSTKSTFYAFKFCMEGITRVKNFQSLYGKISLLPEISSTPGAVERNIRSTIQHMQKNATGYFTKCFPYGQKKLTNMEFLNTAAYFFKRRIEENFGDQVFVQQNSVSSSRE